MTAQKVKYDRRTHRSNGLGQPQSLSYWSAAEKLIPPLGLEHMVQDYWEPDLVKSSEQLVLVIDVTLVV